MASLAAISVLLPYSFQESLLEQAPCLFVDVDERPYLSVLTTLFRLLLNISMHLYIYHCGKQFCPNLAVNFRWISAPFIPSDIKNRIIAWFLSLVQPSVKAIIFKPCSLGTNGLQLNHTRSTSPSDLELQHDQDSPVLPIIQRNYSNISLTFLIPLVFCNNKIISSAVSIIYAIFAAQYNDDLN
jgi:hypothetical protein